MSFQVRSPKLRFEPAFSEEGMELSVRFSGDIQRLVSPEGAALPGQDRQLEQSIDEEVKSLLEELVADTLGRRNDVFLLRSRLDVYKRQAWDCCSSSSATICPK